MPARSALCTSYWHITYVHVFYGYVALIACALVCIQNTQLMDAAILRALCIRYINQEAERSQNPAGPWHQPCPQLWGITVLTSYSIDEFGLLFELCKWS